MFFECEYENIENYFGVHNRRSYTSLEPMKGQVGCFIKISGRNDTTYSLRLSETAGPQGMGGSMNRDIEHFHGWRGTINDTSIYARGWRMIKSIKKRKRGFEWVVILSKDLLPDED